MFLDSATIRDLSIVSTSSASGSAVWSLIDRTRTRIGRDILRQRLVEPPQTAEDIVRLQRGHQALAADSVGYRSALDHADLDGVEAYLAVTWQLPSEMPSLSSVRQWYREYPKDVTLGVGRIRALFDAAADLRSRLALADASALECLAERIALLLNTECLRELQTALSRGSPATAFDQVARGPAKPPLLELVGCLGQVEALWSVGAATREHGWTYPRPSSRLQVLGLTHPFLGSAAVANDLCLDDHVRVCFVTGPNMAGKSTFLKALAIAIVLAHAGSGVPATAMEWPVVGTVFSSVHVEDNMAAGESFYLAEVRRMKALAIAMSHPGSALAVIDEPFRGTNVHDAAEATIAVISRLAACPAGLALIASHVGEAVPALAGDPRVAFLHFSADLTSGEPRFDYRLREGVSTQRLGMTLLKREGVLAILERTAQSLEVG